MELLSPFAEQATLVLERRWALGGLPPALEARVAECTVRFAAARRTADLAATVAGHGAAEREACLGVLRAVAGYLRSVPAPGAGMQLR